jgi:hypothetical protein
MKNRNAKIKFTDIAGMLDRDEMREIIGGCGEFGNCCGGGQAWAASAGFGGGTAIGSSFGGVSYSGYGSSTVNAFYAPSTSGTTVSSISNASFSSAWSFTSSGVTTSDPTAISRLFDFYYKNNMALTTSQINAFITNESSAAGQIANNLQLYGTVLPEVVVQNNYHGPSTIPQGIVIINGEYQIDYSAFGGSMGGLGTGDGVNLFTNAVPPITSHGSISKPTPYEAAVMSKVVYGGPDAGDAVGGWSISHAADGKGIQFNDTGSGLKSQLFEKTLPNGTKEYCYVTAGTEMVDSQGNFDSRDSASNALQLLGISKQYQESTDNAKALVALFGGAISFAGHSLGGGLAEANAIATGVSALTFNAAGLSFLTTGFHMSSNTDAYVMMSDPLNSMQQNSILPSAGGEKHYIEPVSASGWYNGHTIDNVIQSLAGTP